MSDKKILDYTSLDSFLGGKVALHQPIKGYRANIDSVLLASAVDAEKGHTVLELGCGVGTVSLCLMARVNGVNVVGVELQSYYAKLANYNFRKNGAQGNILECCIKQIPSEYKQIDYDRVILNPPYNRISKKETIKKTPVEIAKKEIELCLDDWLDTAITRCAQKGKVVIIHKTERLSQILKLFDRRLGGVIIRPIASKKGEAAKRILLCGEKGSAAPLQILPTFHIHRGITRDDLSTNYTVKAEGILRHAKGLDWT